MKRIIYSNDFNDFLGQGLAVDPVAGQLDADLWSITGFSSDADLSRGTTSGAVSTGGVYAYTSGTDDGAALLLQPGGSDFTPGDITLTLNSGDTDLSDVTVSFDRIVNNDKDRGNSFDLSYSLDGVTFVTVDSFVSSVASDASGFVRETVTVTLPDLAAGTEFFLRWSGDDVSGSGARDEFGIDNLVVEGTEGEGTPDVVVINEVLASTTGSPDSEYVELYGTPGASLAGLSFIGVESDTGTSKGTIDFRYDFADDAVLGDNGFLLMANATAAQTYGVEPNIIIGDFALENSSTTFALVETASLLGDIILGDEVVIDSVASVDADGDSAFFGAPEVGPDGTYLPAGVGRVEDGVDTDSVDDWQILNFNNSTAVNTPTAGTGLGGDTGTGGPGDIDDEPTTISAIQGSTDTAAMLGETVVVEAIVTGDFQYGDDDAFRDLGGFYLMEEVADRDADATTSEGIFVYEGGATDTDVSAGDRVRVLGTVIERFGKTTIEVSEIRIEEAGAVDPLSLAVSVMLPDTEDREALESMLVTVEEALTFSESFDYEDYQQALLTTDGAVYQYSQLNTPDAEGNAAYQAEVANRSILIEDGSGGARSDYDPIYEPDGDLVGTPIEGARMGQSVTGLTAIFDYDFGEYRLRLPEGVDFDLDEDTNPVPTEPADVGSGYKVASFNVLNYFTTTVGLTDIGADPRGAESAEELERQTDKLVEGILGLDADVVGLIEIENDFAGTSFALKTLVEALNAELGTNTWGYVDPGQEFVGDDAIAVAFIYDITTTVLVGDAAILDTEEFLNPLGAGSGGDTFNRAALAQSFQDIEGGGVFTASVNHFKSKGSLTGAAEDVDQGDGAGNNNATRTEAARVLAEWLDTDPTNSGDEDVVILGDLNSYAKETPITTLEDAGYTDLARAFEGEDVYSYRFSGQIGTLDYALANESLMSQVTGATSWTINSDTPVYFDYNLDDTYTGPNTMRPTDQGLFDGDTALRSSDHDPIIVGLNLDDDREIVIAGTAGNDRLNGTDANETLIAGGGTMDIVAGGGGADIFVFGDRDGMRDQMRVLDFDTAEDMLDLNGAAVLSTRVLGQNLLINLDEDRDAIYLAGVTDFAAVTIVQDEFALV